MERKTTVRLEGEVDASVEHQELILTEFNNKDGLTEEVYHDLIEVLEEFDGKHIRLTIDVEE